MERERRGDESNLLALGFLLSWHAARESLRELPNYCPYTEPDPSWAILMRVETAGQCHHHAASLREIDDAVCEVEVLSLC